MNPRPPFADELTPEQELEAFHRLKPRLNEVWDVISAQDDLPATSIVVPSFTLDQLRFCVFTRAEIEARDRVVVILYMGRRFAASALAVVSGAKSSRRSTGRSTWPISR